MFGQILAVILSIVDYFTEGIFLKITHGKLKFISFSAGVSVSYIFLVLLPEVYKGALEVHKLLFLSVLFGFATFHLIEKFIHQRFHGQQLRIEHVIIHSSVSFVYFFVVGFVLVKLAEDSVAGALLLFVPLTLHIIIDSLPRRVADNKRVRIFSASAATLGALLATLAEFGLAGDTVMLGLIGGGLLYQVVRESLPREREGKPMFFITGILSFTVVVLLLWNVGV